MSSLNDEADDPIYLRYRDFYAGKAQPIPIAQARKRLPRRPPDPTSALAITADYFGLFSLFCGLTSIPAIIFGMIALSHLKAHPELKGHSRAMSGLLMGSATLIMFGGLFAYLKYN